MKNDHKRRADKGKAQTPSSAKKRIFKGMRISYEVVWNLFLIFIFILCIGGVFAGGIGAGYFASLVKDQKVLAKEDMIKDIYQYEETSTFYFADNVELGKLRADIDREEVKLEDISDYLKNAVIATEDEYFYTHDGVVPKAVVRAVLQEFTNASVQTGGSTLTQQLVKNQILTNEVSFERKAKEILLALRLEKVLDKDQILEAYLNVSTFGRNSSGQNIGGVQAAAKGIFGVEAKDLSLNQAAFIAGMPQSPFRYTPFTNKGELKDPELLEYGINRMKTVLKRMHREGYITEKELDDAIAYDITADFIDKKPASFEEYPALTFELEERAIKVLMNVLAEKDEVTEDELAADDDLYNKYWTLANRDIRQNGYKIHSTIDKKIYDAMDKAKNEYTNYGPTKTIQVTNPETGKTESVEEPVQVGAILIDNKSGKIISFVGGRDFALEQTNHATHAKRPNGSTMKPLLVYGPAVEMGVVQPGSILPDVPITVPNGSSGTHTFNNYDYRYDGLMTTREALKRSRNTTAVYTWLKIKDRDPSQYLDKMGFTTLTDIDRVVSSAALGGLQIGVTVEENTNAYTTFANGGTFQDAYMIEKIVDSDGEVVFEHKAEPVEVFSPQTAYLMIDMMRDVFRSGTAQAVPSMLKFSSDWAGKTGTTTGPNDAWLVASNPNVTMGSWIGYKTPSPLTAGSTRGQESHRNYGIWAKLLNAAYDVKPEVVAPKEKFQAPGGIVSRSFCAVSGLLPSDGCSKAGLVQTDIFNAKYVPTKVDNSLGSGRYVTANGKKYLALDNTPSEFSQSGALLNPNFVKEITKGISTNTDYLIPKNKANFKNILVADDVLKDDGKDPSAVKANLNGKKLTWSASSSKDVVGYRVYNEKGKKLASIKSGSDLAYNVGEEAYYVVAVDVAGRESKHSNLAGKDEATRKKEAKEKAAKEKKEKEAADKKKQEEIDKKKAQEAADKKEKEEAKKPDKDEDKDKKKDE